MKATAHLAQYDLEDLLDVDRVARRAKNQRRLHRFREALCLSTPRSFRKIINPESSLLLKAQGWRGKETHESVPAE